MIDPYAPPLANLAVAKELPAHDAPNARLLRRTYAALVDTLVLVPAWVLAAQVVTQKPDATARVWAVCVVLLTFVGLAYQLFSFMNRGQTIGKRAFGIAVVRLDGKPLTLVTLFLRGLVVPSLSTLPAIGAVISVGNVVMALGTERRCLHDFLAGTRVITLSDR